MIVLRSGLENGVNHVNDISNYKKQKVLFEVGDIVSPGKRKNGGYYSSSYETLRSGAHYEITQIRTARRGHQLLDLKAVTDGIPSYKDGSAFSGYDARNFELVKKGTGTVNGNAKKAAAWVIIDASTGSVVGSFPLTDPPETETTLTAGDMISGTVEFLGRVSDRNKFSAAAHTERLVDEKIASLLRKNPEGSYMAFKHIKTGKLPILPVEWVSAL